MVKTRIIKTWSWFPAEHSPCYPSLKSDQSELFFKNCTNLCLYGNVKLWSRKEECAENEQVPPQVTLPLKWV